jgi:hypothetical protein
MGPVGRACLAYAILPTAATHAVVIGHNAKNARKIKTPTFHPNGLSDSSHVLVGADAADMK